jgi:hypothetical protein
MRSPRTAAYLFLIAALAAAALWLWRASSGPGNTGEGFSFSFGGSPPASSDPRLAKAWQQMVKAEELLLELTPHLRRLDAGLHDLCLPDEASLPLFAEEVLVADLSPGIPQRTSRRHPRTGSEAAEWAVSELPQILRKEQLRLWAPLLSQVHRFEHGKFYFVSGRHVEGRRPLYESLLGFNGVARSVSGKLLWIRAKLGLTWSKKPQAARGEVRWHIAEWRLEKLETAGADRLLFEEVLDGCLSPADLERARRSLHEEQVLRYLADPSSFEPPHPYFYPPALDRHPGVAVVDLDRDGFDDLYVMERLGKNLFLRNRGDGTFDEVAAELGLDLRDHSSSAVFADFDNDGDADVFVGRTLSPTAYLLNDGARFADRSRDLVDGRLPFFASSLTAVDYDSDGLLDAYVSTYAAHILDELRKVLLKRGRAVDPFFSDHFEPRDGEELARRLLEETYDSNTSRAGPPNILLKNGGDGRFVVAEECRALWVFRNTYQSTWADYDGDGDMDVYLANDFAPNNLFRNDGGGRFVDVSDETGTTDIGFGMGASWGDYDGDGRQDLYVSNMFSKAGTRITARLPELDPRFSKMAQGNSLFRNLPERFEKVSGQSPPHLLVEVAGWSWGGQFLDIDNDGWLDLHALSGYYTAPTAVAIERDL